MSVINLLVAAASLSAAAGGAWSFERALDRYTQISEAPAAAAEDGALEEDEDPKLLY